MISVGSRDGRKGLGPGFDVGREMEETELEEGEAFCYQNDDDSTIDPDVALSYIDEKLQDVLGHFQKDFEGGVSAENLGAKFGGYGSFLPTYQRSPAWSHPRTPPKVHNYNTPRSPNNLHIEVGHHHTLVSPSASQSARLGPAPATVASLPGLRASSVNDSVKRDVCMSSARCAEESTSRCEIVNKSVNPSDQKTLKVRIKVGSDNLSTQKNAEIYSGLGLDVSPSSSLDDSPTDSEGLSREPQDGPDVSPTIILEIMTSFPVHGSLLLSPLPYYLIRLSEKEELWGESRSVPLHKGCQESPLIFMNVSDPATGDRKVLGEKKPKASEKNAFSSESKNGNDNDAQNGIGVLVKKETDIDTLACEELVSNALRLPLLSNSYCNGVDSAKDTARAVDIYGVANKGGLKEKSNSGQAKEEPLELVSTRENDRVEKPNGKAGSEGKLRETGSDDDGSFYLRKGDNLKEEKTDVPAKADSNIFKGRKALKAELIDPPKQKAGQKAASHEENDIKLTSVKDQSSSGGKKKSKESPCHGAQGAEMPKNGLKIDCSPAPKSIKSTHANSHVSKSEIGDFKKDYGKARDRYRDFFGDLDPEQGDYERALEEMPSVDRPKVPVMVEKSTLEFNSPSKERLNGKKIDKPPTAKAYPRPSNGAPLTGNEPISDVAATVAPVVKEDWVCCDKCQKWRLLPLGTNPDSLPEKWLCTMLNWLPGMNRCSISEEETTKAVIAHHQVPAPESRSSQQYGHPGGNLLGVSSVDTQHFNQNHQDLGLHAMPTGGKKKPGLKDISNATNQEDPPRFSNSMKKNLQASAKSRSLNGVDQSPTVNEVDFQHSGQSSSLVAEKHRHKHKVKNKLIENYSVGGDTQNSKIRNKREIGQDCLRASKKIKTDGMSYTDKDRISNHGEAVLKVGRSSSSGSGKDQCNYNERRKDSKGDSKVSVRNPEDQIQITPNDRSPRMGKFDDRDVVKKRKVNESRDTQVYTPSLNGAGHLLQDSRDFIEGTKACKSGEKEACASKGNGETEKKGRSMKDQQEGLDLGSTASQRSLDSLKRDLGLVQPSVAATSSSSKVSGSHKNKANLQEVKGSPVESVSSSPLRNLNPDKLTSTRRNLGGKDDSEDAVFARASPRKCPDGEDFMGSDRSGALRENETLTVTHRGSLESSALDFQYRDLGYISGSKAKRGIIPSSGSATHTNGEVDTLGQSAQYLCKPQTSDQCHNEERRNSNQYHANGSRPRKAGKGSSSRSKDKSRSSRSEFEKGNLKMSDSLNESIDQTPNEERSKTGRNKFREKFACNSDKVEKNAVSKKDSAVKLFNENGKREMQSKFGRHDGSDVRVDAISSQDLKQNLRLDRDVERSSKRFISDKTDRVDVSGRGKSHSLPPSGRGQNETARWPQPLPGSQKENGANILSVDASEGDDPSKTPKQIKKADNQNGNQAIYSKHPMPNGLKARDLDAPSPVRRDSSSQAATNAVKEAKDLKHLADRLKNSGSNLESTVLYFQAALKFLHGASLLESCNSESNKHGEMIQSMQMYSSTAKLCEFCAHEYEKSKDMAAAALAYKCMEVAYMKVIYSSHTSANRDRHELQTALQIVPSGESPSSSASDVDNLNNPATADKVALAKGVSSPQVAGNHVIAARNRSNFVRLLNFAQDVNFAMEASRRSQIAFAAANPRLEEAQYREVISSVKRALDFNFQDVEEVLRLVRLAMDAISR